MSVDRQMSCMRQMEWERVKGGLEAMLCTFYGDDELAKYNKLTKAITTFVTDVEKEGLHE